jgi:endonuclease-3
VNVTEQAREVAERLGRLYPDAHIALGYETDFQLLVAVVLSAQTTDVGVNKVTPVLFGRYPFGGRVPDTMEDLVSLPGVARKTANIVLFNAFGKLEGVAVDTHVFRLARRLGLSAEKDAEKVERDLMRVFPREIWGIMTYRLIEHGRAICEAKRPICGECRLNDICPSAFKEKGWREHA